MKGFLTENSDWSSQMVLKDLSALKYIFLISFQEIFIPAVYLSIFIEPKTAVQPPYDLFQVAFDTRFFFFNF